MMQNGETVTWQDPSLVSDAYLANYTRHVASKMGSKLGLTAQMELAMRFLELSFDAYKKGHYIRITGQDMHGVIEARYVTETNIEIHPTSDRLITVE